MKTQKVYIDGTSGHHMQYDAATDRQAAHVEAKVVSAQTIQHKSNSDGVLYGSDSDPASVSVTRSKELLRMAPRILSEIGDISRNLLELIDIRRRYIAVSSQRSADNPRNGTDWVEFRSFCGSECVYASSTAAVGPQAAGEESDVRQPGSCPCIEHDQPRLETDPAKFHLNDSGIYEISKDRNSGDASLDIPTLQDFYRDLSHMLAVSSNGPTKSFAYSRLEHLEGKFRMYTLENSHQEVLACKNVLHRDFYNVRKVDTHIHHSACMNQKHLLRFIKSKLRTSPNEVVLWKDGVSLTLSEVFASLRLTAYDLNIDTLDMHAHMDSFHRFDKFNLKYNPIGEPRLRTIFLKTDNMIQGRYLAEITTEVIADLEASKYQLAEWRVSVYGKAMEEWDKLAAWVLDNNLISSNIRWLIQIPRLYNAYKANGLVQNFGEIIANIFQPLFEVTRDPLSHPKLHIFLQRVVGIDSVDDESKPEIPLPTAVPFPQDWTMTQNPPYSYWLYHLYANLAVLNRFRSLRGYNTFLLRPHSCEAGDTQHLAVAALTSHSISHGLLLRKVPVVQYLYYLEQIGIAMSPLSNNALFLAYDRNPFPDYFRRGLNVSLSTDDPLQVSLTKEPLMEEYAIATQIYKLSPVDTCELAKNSVKQSGFEDRLKRQWLGADFDQPGEAGNDVNKTNVPDSRERFRHNTLEQEKKLLWSHAEEV